MNVTIGLIGSLLDKSKRVGKNLVRVLPYSSPRSIGKDLPRFSLVGQVSDLELKHSGIPAQPIHVAPFMGCERHQASCI